VSPTSRKKAGETSRDFSKSKSPTPSLDETDEEEEEEEEEVEQVRVKSPRKETLKRKAEVIT
jgi:hypothetical protein